jgi:hypothetical protein
VFGLEKHNKKKKNSRDWPGSFCPEDYWEQVPEFLGI